MLSKRITHLLLVSIIGSITLPAIADDPFAPGSWLNPYVIRRGIGNEYEVRTRYPYLHADPFSPGSWLNPYVIRRGIGNEYEVRAKYPFLLQ